MTEKKARRRLFSRTGDRVMLGTLLAMVAATLILNGLDAAGLRLVQGAFYIFLPIVTVLTTLGWGGSVLLRRIQRPKLRRVVTVLLLVLLVLLVMLALQYGGFLAGLTVPQKYAVMKSPDGAHRLIVMRGIDTDADRAEARRSARLAADPEGDEAFVVNDWGYVYTAYAPGPLGLFYRPDTLIDGEVYIGYASEGELMLQWEDDGEVGYFFVKDPGPGDGGEMRARSGQ